MNKSSKIYIAGHNGLVGSAIMQALHQQGYNNLVTQSHAELELTNQQDVNDFFSRAAPEFVILAAAKVGGIVANNNYPAEFIYENLAIQSNIIHAAYQTKVKRLLFLGSSCIYPRNCPQPIKEEYLLTGSLELSNRPYALAKIAGIEQCWSYNRQYNTQYLAVMPTNLYGPGDNYHLENSHVIPALIRKFHEAKQNQQAEVVLWGTGTVFREFLYSKDMAKGCLFLLDLPENQYANITASDAHPPLINLGYGSEITIAGLAKLVQQVTRFAGAIVWDNTKPDGTPRKLLDSQQLTKLGWQASIDLKQGLRLAYQNFQQYETELRK